MLDTGRPTCTTGGRSSRELTGNDPRTDRSRSTHKDGRPFFGRYPRQYAVVVTYYWVRSRATSLVGLFVFPFVLFGHFFVFRDPGAGASGHTGSPPGCVRLSVLCQGGAKVKVQVDLTACRFLKAQHNSTSFQREAKFHETAKGSEVRVHQASHGYSTALFLWCVTGLSK